MSVKPNSRDRKRLLQSGGQIAPSTVNKSGRDRSQLPGYDRFPDLSHTAKTPGSHVKKQQSKLNTPTKTPATTPGVAGQLDSVLILQPAMKPNNGTGVNHRDPYDFPGDDALDDENRAAAAAVNPANLPHKPAARQRLQGINKLSPRSNAAGITSAAGINNSTRIKKMVTSAARQLDLSSSAAAGGLGQPGRGSKAHDSLAFRDVPTSAAAGYSSKWLGTMTGSRSKQTGIKCFTVTQHQLSAQYSGSLPAGMVNHGNTCYLNAVLQALLSFKCLSDDLTSSKLQELSLNSNGVTMALQKCLQHHTASGNSARASGSSAISPAAVSAAMAHLDSRWGLCRQEDAHEFLTALLDALQTEVLAAQGDFMKRSSDKLAAPSSSADNRTASGHETSEQNTAADLSEETQALGLSCSHNIGQPAPQVEPATAGSVAAAQQLASTGPCLGVSATYDPASRNFTGCLQHTLTCSSCGHVTVVKEQFNHLSLDLPAPGSTLQQQPPQQPTNDSGVRNLLGGVSSPEPLVPELQSLLANFFAPETLEKSCEACKAGAIQHSLQHAVRRLPRVLVVHLKRFQWQVIPEGGAICRKLPTRVKPDYELHLGGVCCSGRPVPPLIAELMPAGLLERAQQAMGIQQADTTGDMDSAVATQPQQRLSVGSKRCREIAAEGDGVAVSDAAHSTDQNAAAINKKHQHQQSLLSAWGNAGQDRVIGKSRLERMTVANGQQSVGSPRARHTDLTKLGADKQQQKPMLGTTAADSDPMIVDDGNDADLEDDAEHLSFGNLRKVSSSTALADSGRVVRDDEEDAELQRALAESMRTHEAELQQRNRQGTAGTAATSSPAAATQQVGESSPSLAAGVGAEQLDDDLPDWVKQAHAAAETKAAAAAAAAPVESLPCTPQSSPKHSFKQYLAGKPVVFAKGGIRQPLQPLTDLTGADNLFHWGSVCQSAQEPGLGPNNCPQDEQQQAAAGSSGGLGLSGGVDFSDATPAKASGGPASVQQWQRTAGGLFDDLPLLSATAAAGSGGLMPRSPIRNQLEPVMGGKIAVNGKNNNSSDNSSAMHVDGVTGLAGMTEEEQLELAIKESMKEHDMQPKTERSAGSSSPVGGLPGIDVENYDYEAALQKALEESAAAAAAAVDPGAADKAEAKPAAVAELTQADSLKAEADDGDVMVSADAVAGEAEVECTEDDTVLVVREVSQNAADSQKSVQPRLPLVRLVEDSDCEDEKGHADHTRQHQQQQQGSVVEPKQVSAPLQPENKLSTNSSSSRPAAASSHQTKDLSHSSGKENAENQQLQHLSAVKGAGQNSTKPRRPLGEILGNRNANVAANAAAPAEAIPVKRPATVAAVAASEAAAAAAAGNAVNGSTDLTATEAAAAAEAVGHWPQENAATYRLRAVVRHKGPLASSGHFVSDVKSNMRDGEWFHYDDSYVQPIRFCNVVRDCQQDGYLFFYVNRAILPVMTGKAPSRK